MDVHKVANNCISGSYISIAGLTTSRVQKHNAYTDYYLLPYYVSASRLWRQEGVRMRIHDTMGLN